MDEDKREFILVEYSALRDEVMSTLKEVPDGEKLALLFSGAYWAWLLSNVIPYSVAVWVPALITCLFSLRVISINKKFSSLNKYLTKVEESFNLEGLGWESFLDAKQRNWFAWYQRVFWASLFIGNIIAAFVTLSQI